VPTSSLAAGVGATIADPVVAEYVSMEAVARLLQGRDAPLREGAAEGALRLDSLHAAWRLFAEAESRASGDLLRAAPGPARGRAGAGPAAPCGFTWRLVGVRLPDAVTDRLVQELIRREPAAADAPRPQPWPLRGFASSQG
jgi:hypothetical protein